jgi:hypothetical protein
MTVVTTFGSMTGSVSAALLDSSFALCASQTDLTATNAAVTALQANTAPLAPAMPAVTGVSTRLAKQDHQHPPQPATPSVKSGTTYTLTANDNGQVLEFSNASAITVTIEADLPVGFSCVMVQTLGGQVTFVAEAGATQRQRQGFTKTAGQWAMVSMYVSSNAGSAAVYVLSGDMAA